LTNSVSIAPVEVIVFVVVVVIIIVVVTNVAVVTIILFVLELIENAAFGQELDFGKKLWNSLAAG